MYTTNLQTQTLFETFSQCCNLHYLPASPILCNILTLFLSALTPANKITEKWPFNLNWQEVLSWHHYYIMESIVNSFLVCFALRCIHCLPIHNMHERASNTKNLTTLWDIVKSENWTKNDLALLRVASYLLAFAT
jgi:hypothetical protein